MLVQEFKFLLLNKIVDPNSDHENDEDEIHGNPITINSDMKKKLTNFITSKMTNIINGYLNGGSKSIKHYTYYLVSKAEIIDFKINKNTFTIKGKIKLLLKNNLDKKDFINFNKLNKPLVALNRIPTKITSDNFSKLLFSLYTNLFLDHDKITKFLNKNKFNQLIDVYIENQKESLDYYSRTGATPFMYYNIVHNDINIEKI